MSKPITQHNRTMKCPCGCGIDVTYLFGTVRRNGATFRTLLSREGSHAIAWTMLVNGPWPEYVDDCAAIIKATLNHRELCSELAEMSDSPWHKEPKIESLQVLTLDQIDAIYGAGDWILDQWKRLVDGQPEIHAHLSLEQIPDNEFVH